MSWNLQVKLSGSCSWVGRGWMGAGWVQDGCRMCLQEGRLPWRGWLSANHLFSPCQTWGGELDQIRAEADEVFTRVQVVFLCRFPSWVSGAGCSVLSPVLLLLGVFFMQREEIKKCFPKGQGAGSVTQLGTGDTVRAWSPCSPCSTLSLCHQGILLGDICEQRQLMGGASAPPLGSARVLRCGAGIVVCPGEAPALPPHLP